MDERVLPSEETGNGRLAGHAVLVKLSWAMRSDPGALRPTNEDFAGVYAPTIPDDAWDRGALFVVADGLGGHAAGEVASRIAVDTVLARWMEGNPGLPHQMLRAAIRDANAAVYDAAMDVGRRGMGTTVTAMTLSGREAIIAHVGDSRAYLVRGGHCTQLTSDHSRAAEMVRMKLITPEQAATHPNRSMLTRSLGATPSVQIDLVRQGVDDKDVLVLCSDGLWDTVSRAEIADVSGAIGHAFPTPNEAAEHLIDLALKRGAPDNITVLVVRITSPLPFPPSPAKRSFFRRGGS
ncbi:MAG: PP2C family protein-serine/threonine phosphatase [Actinomycetota bacterium]